MTQSNEFKGKTVNNISVTGAEVVVPAGMTWVLIGLTISNAVEDNITVVADMSVEIDGNDVIVMSGTNIHTGGYHNVIGGEVKLVLKEGDKIKVKTNDVSHAVDLLINYLERSGT